MEEDIKFDSIMTEKSLQTDGEMHIEDKKNETDNKRLEGFLHRGTPKAVEIKRLDPLNQQQIETHRLNFEQRITSKVGNNLEVLKPEGIEMQAGTEMLRVSDVSKATKHKIKNLVLLWKLLIQDLKS
jgi:hypothetical protein